MRKILISKAQPLNAGLLGERDVVVVVPGGRLRSGQTDFFIGRGQRMEQGVASYWWWVARNEEGASPA